MFKYACNGARFPRESLAGRRFGRLYVLDFAGRVVGKGYAYWNCVCDCGKNSVVTGDSLKCGRSRSCGCGIQEGLRKANITHGKSKTPEYRLWAGMLMRCYNEKEKAYRYYGALGVTVCDRWRRERGFENFLADMGQRPSSKHSIERKKNNIGYEPLNCRWATREEQANNKSSNIRVVLNLEPMSLSKACRQMDLPYRTIYSRMRRHGLSFEEAVSGQRYARLEFQKARPSRT